MKFIEGSPTFAVEAREHDESGDEAEAMRAAKRVDYFAAGTLVVWDVDPVGETVTCYRHTAPSQGVIWGRGAIADAEPAVPGWRITVDEVFA
jgi:Uma2 family endonuclease